MGRNLAGIMVSILSTTLGSPASLEYVVCNFLDLPGRVDDNFVLHQLVCNILKLFPRALQCPKKPPSNPPPSDGYTQTFSNLTGATQAGDYMTFGLVETVAGGYWGYDACYSFSHR